MAHPVRPFHLKDPFGMQPRDFSTRKKFPGTVTSGFDALVRLAQLIDHLPAVLFATMLFALALLPGRFELSSALVLFAFFVGDWILIALLPRANKSFGPVQPPTLFLAGLRLIPGALAAPWNTLAQLLGTFLVVYGFWIEPHQLRVTYQSLRSSKLPAEMPPLRAMHLGDLHVERITTREERLLERVRDLKPDLILFSGDLLNLSNVDDPVAWEHVRSMLRKLAAPLGVYGVSGSPPVDKPLVFARLLEGLENIRWLRDERATLCHAGQPIDVVGITCTHNPTADRVSLDDILHGDSDNLTILLYHSPDLGPDAAAQGVDLQLSGHTHGGQVRLPFFGAIYTSSLYGKRFEVGRHQLGDLTLYVTRGIGMEGMGMPRVRFLCPPEITLWEISAR